MKKKKKNGLFRWYELQEEYIYKNQEGVFINLGFINATFDSYISKKNKI